MGLSSNQDLNKDQPKKKPTQNNASGPVLQSNAQANPSAAGSTLFSVISTTFYSKW